MARVFVVQEPVRFNRTTQTTERKFDLRPAAAYGDIDILLDSEAKVLNPGPMVHTLQRKLAHYTSDDFILPTGNPTAIGLAVAIAAVNNQGWVNVLVWHGETRAYVCVKANIYGRKAN